MQSIENNPYRTLGLLAGASDKDILTRASRLKKYISVDQTLEDDFNFPVLGDTERSVERINAAAAKLNHNEDKVEAALFWFVKAGIVDEPAIDQLLDNNLSGAEETWAKVVKKDAGAEVNLRNFSAFQNLSTLKLNRAFAGPAVDEGALSEGVLLKLKLLENDSYKHFISHVCDANFKTSSSDLQVIFLSQTQREAEKRGFPNGKFVSILSGATFAAKGIYLGSQSGSISTVIEELIEETKKKRKSQPQNAHAAGKKLFEQTLDPLAQLRSMVGGNDLKFTNISDKVALEVLQCGIDYFNFHQESDSTDPGPGALDCLKKAKTIAILKSTQDRCQENIDNVQEWVNDKPQRERMKEVFVDIANLHQLLEKFEGAASIQSARQLLNESRQYLVNIRARLGSADEFYLGVSTTIGSKAFGMVVDEINSIQKALPHTPEYQLPSLFQRLQTAINSGLDILNTISNMDLFPNFRKQLDENRGTVQGLRNKLSQVSSGGYSNSSSSDSGGCYIATMVYGDYEHPQVQELRRFRDEILATSEVGRLIIKIYYQFSPAMVRRLRHNYRIHCIIRILLNNFIKNLKK